MKIGEKLKELRIERGWSQEQVANHLGYKSRSTINKIELGINDLTQSRILAFAKLFHVEPGQLLSDEPLNMDEIKSRWIEADHEETISKQVSLLQAIQDQWGKDSVKMLELFTGLNSDGQKKAITQLEDLSEIPKYRKEESP